MAALAPAQLDAHKEQQLHLARLQGLQGALATQCEELKASIGLAKARIELAPAVAEVHDILQRRAHHRAVGDFETLLSALLAEVFPEAGTIQLDLRTERGAPALDIHLRTKDGQLEDIIHGNGGALTNIISTGLVFAARSRTSTRPLVVLDEPDCWMKDPAQVRPFMKVIADVAHTTQCQTLLVSHCNPSFLPDDIHLIQLVARDGIPEAHSISGATPWLDDNQVGLRWLEVENVRLHKHTRVEFSPGPNAVIGDHNLGKSTLLCSSLRALALGDHDDSLIRHDEPMCRVRVQLEQGIELEMVRRRTGTPKVLYRKYQGGVLTNEEAPRVRGEVPAFIREAMNIDYVDGLDIHLRHQKTPVFLLNEPPARRAKLLSVGRESGLLQQMATQQRAWLKRDRELVRTGESNLAEVLRKLAALEPLSGMPSLVGLVDEIRRDCEKSDLAIKQLAPLVQQLHNTAQAVEALSPARDLRLPVAPRLPDVAALAQLVTRLELAQRAQFAPPLPALVPLVKLKPTQTLRQLLTDMDIARAGAVKQVLPMSPVVPKLVDTQALAQVVHRLQRPVTQQTLPVVPPKPQLAPSEGLRELLTKLNDLAKTGKQLATSVKAVAQSLAAAQTADTALRTQIGVCPLCQQSLLVVHSHAKDSP